MSDSNNSSGWFSSIGTVIAMALSYKINASIGWLILHGIFGWFYIIYWVFQYSNILTKLDQFIK